MGLNMNERKAVTRTFSPLEYRLRYKRAGKPECTFREKSRLLDEFTRLTGYHRKKTIRALNKKPLPETVVFIEGKPVNLKPEKI